MERIRVASFLVAAAWAIAQAGCERPRHEHRGGIDAPSLYSHTCAPCHGEDGHGQTQLGRSLGARDLMAAEARALSDGELRHIVVAGRGRMPPFGQALDEDEVQALVEELRARQAKAAPPTATGK